ncbi:MAG: dTDP-4-dehydrorhamnose 3,5-epimerase [Candidatus Electrothrix sp. AU1_5]|nr:dTDP-4-dehydrorhamnose 3,5-epimerase [Candidatus Electrothrix gigas]
MNRFTVSNLPLVGLKCVMRQRLGDQRGFLSRLFCTEELAAAGWKKPVAQINHTFTARCGTVRGLHYQLPPQAEMKLVSCICGEVWDVAVDLRADSSTFLQWYAEKLSAENGRGLLIPEGFAHGFQTLTDNCELLYLHTAVYTPQAEAGLRFDDLRLNISWPLAVTELSARDQAHPLLTETFRGIDIA